MITYVNTVLVSNVSSSNVFVPAEGHLEPTAADAGKFVFMTLDEGVENPYNVTKSNAASFDRIKVGIVTNATAPQVNYSTGATTYVPIIKWSNVISADSIKNIAESKYEADTEDTITISFADLDESLENLFALGGKRIIVRLTFKDLPTRFRKWTESYEYVTKEGDTKTSIAQNISDMINREYKRARVTSTASEGVITLTAMKYDDDNSVDSINWYNKIRFNANVYYTDPAAEGWESINKHFPKGVEINKEPGKTYVASAKLVRDREAQAMGYLGILNRGEGTWPIIKPEMQTKLDGHYNAITLEFERMYRTADDLQRRTKECVEIYINGSAKGVAEILNAFNGTETSFTA